MKLNKTHKLERLDSMNIALYKHSTVNGKTHWQPIRFWGNWDDAVRSSIEYLTLSKIDGVRGVRELSAELSRTRSTIAYIAKSLASQIRE